MTVCLQLALISAWGQKENALIRSGNRYYKQKDMERSQQEYQKALSEAPSNPTVNYNLGNTAFRKNNFEDAVKSYDASIDNSKDNAVKEKGLYNKGVAEIKQQKLPESIDSWKKALKLDPSDTEARENLEKALQELNMKQPKQQPDQQKDKKQDQHEQEQPKPQQSRLSKQQVDQLLKALQQKEKEVQDKMNQSKVPSAGQPDKDW
jgi:Ca-activated chloride channel homolog